MAMTTDTSTAYDTVAYPSHCCPQAHPDRLATLATLFGMTPAPAERCRFLELGCGDGHNLLALAFALPGSTFVGVDLAPSAIANGKDEARALGLANVDLHCADLLDWTPPDGPFDYVIAHGLISWVPEAVRRRVFELCRDRLAPQGVAYISYNALPGWHLRGMVRQMMLFHTQHFPDPAQKIAQAKAFLGLLLAGKGAEDGPAAAVKREAKRILDRGIDALLFHDDLAEINQPFYFHEFAALAGHHGLQYLAEADFVEMQVAAHPPPVVAALRQLGDDIVVKEQYLDFLKCRRFRQTLLCRADVPLKREMAPGLMRQFLIASDANPVSTNPNLSAGAAEEFSARGATLQVDDPLTKVAMLELRTAWPRALPFGELVRAARRCLNRPPEVDDGGVEPLAEALLTAYAANMVELHVWQAPWDVAREGRPVLSPLVRRQLTNGQEVVTSLRHTDSPVGAPALRALLLLLDGTRDVPAVAAELGRRIDACELALPEGVARQNLLAEVARTVREVAASGLLIAWDAAGDR
jgi:SAM-dependent methyltransferase